MFCLALIFRTKRHPSYLIVLLTCFRENAFHSFCSASLQTSAPAAKCQHSAWPPVFTLYASFLVHNRFRHPAFPACPDISGRLTKQTIPHCDKLNILVWVKLRDPIFTMSKRRTNYRIFPSTSLCDDPFCGSCSMLSVDAEFAQQPHTTRAAVNESNL